MSSEALGAKPERQRGDAARNRRAKRRLPILGAGGPLSIEGGTHAEHPRADDRRKRLPRDWQEVSNSPAWRAGVACP